MIARPRACSSVDRASASGAEGRRFESCRARHYNLFRQRERQSVRVCRRGQPTRHELPATDDPLVDGVDQVGLRLGHSAARHVSPRARSHSTARFGRDPVAPCAPRSSARFRGAPSAAPGRPSSPSCRRRARARARASGARSGHGRCSPDARLEPSAATTARDGRVVEPHLRRAAPGPAPPTPRRRSGPARPSPRRGRDGACDGGRRRRSRRSGCAGRRRIRGAPRAGRRGPQSRGPAAPRLARAARPRPSPRARQRPAGRLATAPDAAPRRGPRWRRIQPL